MYIITRHRNGGSPSEHYLPEGIYPDSEHRSRYIDELMASHVAYWRVCFIVIMHAQHDAVDKENTEPVWRRFAIL